jgi:endonuclease YncB( thermonuclease family)
VPTIAGWIVWAALLALVWVRPSPAGAPARIEFSEGQLWGMVRTVVDEKRLTVVTSDLVLLELRLAGMDMPERSYAGPPGTPDLPGQPFGEEALVYLRDLLLDRQVRVDTYGRDPSGRLLAVVWLGEISVNLALVKEGLAWVDPAFKVTKVRVGLDVAERQAQVGRYGLWGLENPEAPWEFRKQRGLAGKPSP